MDTLAKISLGLISRNPDLLRYAEPPPPYKPSNGSSVIPDKSPKLPRDVICSSRFHPKTGLSLSLGRKVSKGSQYVCPMCREIWAGRNVTAQQVEEEGIQEGLNAAQLLLYMAENGDIAMTDGPTKEAGSDGKPYPELLSSPKDKPSEANTPPTSLNLEPFNMGQQSPKRKLDVPEADSPKKKKRRLSDSPPPQLPLEIVSMIITAATDSTPKCALDLLVPDWNICNGNNDKLQRDMLDSRRVVTYTRGIDGGVGTLSSAAGSADHSHIFLPMQTLDTDLMSVNEAFLDENIRSFFQEGTQVFQLTANYPPPDVAEASFLKWWRDSFPLRGERSRLILPFDDEVDGTPKREMSSGGPCLFKLLRHIVVNSPLALMDVNARSMVGPGTGISEKNLKALDDAIDLDRAAHLWLSWSQMPMLKSVLLDLRIYSHDLNTERECISKYDIVRRAEEMGRWLQLDLLVIAGLQSYSFQASNEVYTAGQIEEVDEIDDEPNWIKVFMPAVRPGGKLVLVDSLT